LLRPPPTARPVADQSLFSTPFLNAYKALSSPPRPDPPPPVPAFSNPDKKNTQSPAYRVGAMSRSPFACNLSTNNPRRPSHALPCWLSNTARTHRRHAAGGIHIHSNALLPLLGARPSPSRRSLLPLLIRHILERPSTNAHAHAHHMELLRWCV